MSRRPHVSADDVRMIRALGDMRQALLDCANCLIEEAAHHRGEALKLTDELIGEKFGVGKNCINKILRGKTHKGEREEMNDTKEVSKARQIVAKMKADVEAAAQKKEAARAELLEVAAKIESGEWRYKDAAAAMGITDKVLRKRFLRAGITVLCPRNGRGPQYTELKVARTPATEQSVLNSEPATPWDRRMANNWMSQPLRAAA